MSFGPLNKWQGEGTLVLLVVSIRIRARWVVTEGLLSAGPNKWFFRTLGSERYFGLEKYRFKLAFKHIPVTLNCWRICFKNVNFLPLTQGLSVQIKMFISESLEGPWSQHSGPWERTNELWNVWNRAAGGPVTLGPFSHLLHPIREKDIRLCWAFTPQGIFPLSYQI